MQPLRSFSRIVAISAELALSAALPYTKAIQRGLLELLICCPVVCLDELEILSIHWLISLPGVHNTGRHTNHRSDQRLLDFYTLCRVEGWSRVRIHVD